jgi:hypothetical protein
MDVLSPIPLYRKTEQVWLKNSGQINKRIKRSELSMCEKGDSIGRYWRQNGFSPKKP